MLIFDRLLLSCCIGYLFLKPAASFPPKSGKGLTPGREVMTFQGHTQWEYEHRSRQLTLPAEGLPVLDLRTKVFEEYLNEVVCQFCRNA
jgi:hypothetical protein